MDNMAWHIVSIWQQQDKCEEQPMRRIGLFAMSGILHGAALMRTPFAPRCRFCGSTFTDFKQLELHIISSICGFSGGCILLVVANKIVQSWHHHGRASSKQNWRGAKSVFTKLITFYIWDIIWAPFYVESSITFDHEVKCVNRDNLR